MEFISAEDLSLAKNLHMNLPLSSVKGCKVKRFQGQSTSETSFYLFSLVAQQLGKYDIVYVHILPLDIYMQLLLVDLHGRGRLNAEFEI